VPFFAFLKEPVAKDNCAFRQYSEFQFISIFAVFYRRMRRYGALDDRLERHKATAFYWDFVVAKQWGPKNMLNKTAKKRLNI